LEVWVSPKAGAPLALDRADEVKLVFPQDGLAPEELEHIAALHRWLLPMDGPALEANTKAALAYGPEHPRWRLNIQVYQNVLGRAGEAGGRA
jgi:7-carboxy-7-deazaguanine synthase